ncbi:hypothetical protein [Palleronia caenipelagi]|uniref:Uncharacterized protein n=1 Tax=Palleronia caenipelagi TaxID=2489174 RepID=A0A547PNQ1_9RHOB|nr:hypothetical protein [Palleronia caenipelagi]TRD15772.1 hypothetical protein FEV53_15030 [Palleronia caenipelagi]
MMMTVIYESVDGCRREGKFSEIEDARTFAVKWVGHNPDIGGGYAVSADGIGKVTTEGLTLEELFEQEAQTKDEQVGSSA